MVRKTYHYDPDSGEMVEGPAPRRVDGPSGDGWRYSDRLYSSAPFTAHDGTIIDSKKKHREYMKRYNLTTIDDMNGVWEGAAKEREKFFTAGDYDTQSRREAVIDAINRRSRNG